MSISLELEKLEWCNAYQIDYKAIIIVVDRNFGEVSHWLLLPFNFVVNQKSNEYMNKKDSLEHHREGKVKIEVVGVVRVP